MTSPSVSVPVKVQLGDTPTLRRFQLNGQRVKQLHHALDGLFPELKGNAFLLTWRDEDDDWVSIVNDEDLAIAVESSTDTTLRLRVAPTGAASTVAPTGVPHSSPAPPLPEVQEPATQSTKSATKAAPPPKAPAAADTAETKGDGKPDPAEHFRAFMSNLMGRSPYHGAVGDCDPSAGTDSADPAEHFRIFITNLCEQAPPHIQRVVQHLHQHNQHPAEPVVIGDPLPIGSIGPGSHGPGVEQLQRFLIKHELMHSGAIRYRAGVYGPNTARAVWSFQQKMGLATTNPGVFDESTSAALVAHFDDTKNATTKPPPTPTAPTAPPMAAAAARTTSAEPAATKQQPWAAELEGLRAMGFENVDMLVPLLEQFKGSVDQLLAVLLDEVKQ